MMLVTCALIEKNGKVLVAQRSATMPLPLKWEFPGGKLEGGESPEACVIREIREELGLEIKPVHRLPDAPWPHYSKPIVLLPFICQCLGGALHLAEHQQVSWVLPEQLSGLDWAAADVPVVETYLAWKALGDQA